MNKNKITTYQDLWDTGNISAERGFHNTKCFIRKQEKSQICNLIFLLKNLVNEKKSKTSIRNIWKKIKISADICELKNKKIIEKNQ